jgi:hypothetical protein
MNCVWSNEELFVNKQELVKMGQGVFCLQQLYEGCAILVLVSGNSHSVRVFFPSSLSCWWF